MKKLLIATSNPGKINMFKELLDWINLELIFLSDLKQTIPSPIEDWSTVEDNALLKAKYYSEKTWIDTLADDAWFEIDELNWKPGIMARRWWWELRDDVSDEDWLDFYMDKTRHLWDKLHASFPFSRCLYLTNWKYYFQSDKIPFYLSRNPRIPFKPWWPISAIRVFEDWRHEMDIPPNDEVWNKQAQREDLWKLLENIL